MSEKDKPVVGVVVPVQGRMVRSTEPSQAVQEVAREMRDGLALAAKKYPPGFEWWVTAARDWAARLDQSAPGSVYVGIQSDGGYWGMPLIQTFATQEAMEKWVAEKDSIRHGEFQHVHGTPQPKAEAGDYWIVRGPDKALRAFETETEARGIADSYCDAFPVIGAPVKGECEIDKEIGMSPCQWDLAMYKKGYAGCHKARDTALQRADNLTAHLKSEQDAHQREIVRAESAERDLRLEKTKTRDLGVKVSNLRERAKIGEHNLVYMEQAERDRVSLRTRVDELVADAETARGEKDVWEQACYDARAERRLELTNLRINQRIDPKQFEYTPPEGVEVIDQTDQPADQ